MESRNSMMWLEHTLKQLLSSHCHHQRQLIYEQILLCLFSDRWINRDTPLYRMHAKSAIAIGQTQCRRGAAYDKIQAVAYQKCRRLYFPWKSLCVWGLLKNQQWPDFCTTSFLSATVDVHQKSQSLSRCTNKSQKLCHLFVQCLTHKTHLHQHPLLHLF